MSYNTIAVMVTKMAMNIDLCSKESIFFVFQSKQVHWPIKKLLKILADQDISLYMFEYFLFSVFSYILIALTTCTLYLYIKFSIDTDHISAICIFRSARALKLHKLLQKKCF